MLHVELENILTEDELAGKLATVLARADAEKQIYVITRGGKPSLAIIDLPQLENLSGRDVRVAAPKPLFSEVEVDPTVHAEAAAPAPTVMPEMPNMPDTLPAMPSMPETQATPLPVQAASEPSLAMPAPLGLQPSAPDIRPMAMPVPGVPVQPAPAMAATPIMATQSSIPQAGPMSEPLPDMPA
jgi:hypothetical protein